MTIRVYSAVLGLFILASGVMASSYAEGVIYHNPPTETTEQEPLTLEAIVEVEDANVVSGSIYYRLRGQATYQLNPMSAAGGGLFLGTIPAADIIAPGLEYYIVATLDDQSILSYPVDNPEVNPVFVAVQTVSERITSAIEELTLETDEANILILSPEPMQIYLAEEVVIAASLFNVQDIDVSSIRIMLDGQDVTAEADITSDLIVYTPPSLAMGPHPVEILINRTSGTPYAPVAWRFLVTERATATTAQAFRQSGSITPLYRRDNIDDELLEVSSLRFSYRAGWNWLQISSSLKLTSEEDPYKAPRNRYSATFQTPLLTLGIGDVTPRFGRFGLDGKRLRGYDANLTLGLVNLRVAKGELERAIQGRPEQAFSVIDFDSAADTLYISRGGYAFRRDILAIRPSLGSGERFELAFSYLKIKDNVASVNQIVDDGIVTIDSSDAADDNIFASANWIDDTLRTIYYRDLMRIPGLSVSLPEDDWTGKTPQDNLVIGSSLSLTMDQRRFTMQTGFALSMLNKNIWDPVLTKDELDTFAPGDDTTDGFIGGEGGINLEDLPIDPSDLENIFHINLNQVPLLPIAIDSASLANPFKLISKMPSLAYHGTLKLNYMRNFITLEYQQVGPEFNSLANPNLQKNVRSRSISDRIRLFDNRLFITAVHRATDDDIVKVEGDPITSTQMTNITANINPGEGLPSLSLGQRRYTRDNGIDTLTISLDAEDNPIDTTDSREEMLSRSTNLGLSYRLQLLTSTHDLNLNIANTAITDQISKRDPSFKSLAANSRVVSLSAVSYLTPELETSVVISSNKSEVGEEDYLITQNISTTDLSARLLLMDGSMRVRGGFRIKTNETNQDENSQAPASFRQLSLRGGVSYELIENLRLVASLEFRTKTLFDQTELIDLNDNGVMDPGESYNDVNDNGKYDAGIFDMTLPSSIISANLEYTF